MDFAELFSGFQPVIMNLEEQRSSLQSEVNKRIKRSMIFISLISILAAVLAYELTNLIPVAFMAAFTFMIFGYFAAAGIIKSGLRKRRFVQLNQKFRDKIISPILTNFKLTESPAAEAFSDKSLIESHLFYIKSNTEVKISDSLIGNVNGKDISMARVTTVSYRKESDRGSMDSDKKPYGDRSRQSFSGLVMRLDGIDTKEQCFLVPAPRSLAEGMKDVTDAFQAMNFKNEAGMSRDAQKSHNLDAMRKGMTSRRGFDFRAYMLPEDQIFVSHEIDFGKERDYIVYHQEKGKPEILKNDKLFQILSMEDKPKTKVPDDSFVKDFRAFFRSGNPLKNGIAIAIHSGKAWAAIPTASDFNLDLDQPLDREYVGAIYDALAAGLIVAHAISKEDE